MREETQMKFEVRLLILGILLLLYTVQPLLGWTAISFVALYVTGTLFRRAPQRT
jgi:hypothetical protein